MSDVTIYYSPFCVISRNALALIRHAGIEPTIVDYLRTPPNRAALLELVAVTGGSVRPLVRLHSPYAADLGLFHWADEALFELVLERPLFLNRPIVATPLGTKVCRPSETLLELLPVPQLPPFTKEDGSVVVDSGRRRW